jgi:hypothetical protein
VLTGNPARNPADSPGGTMMPWRAACSAANEPSATPIIAVTACSTGPSCAGAAPTARDSACSTAVSLPK